MRKECFPFWCQHQGMTKEGGGMKQSNRPVWFRLGQLLPPNQSGVRKRGFFTLVCPPPPRQCFFFPLPLQTLSALLKPPTPSKKAHPTHPAQTLLPLRTPHLETSRLSITTASHMCMAITIYHNSLLQLYTNRINGWKLRRSVRVYHVSGILVACPTPSPSPSPPLEEESCCECGTGKVYMSTIPGENKMIMCNTRREITQPTRPGAVTREREPTWGGLLLLLLLLPPKTASWASWAS